jgi:hypothetical protein
MRERGRGGELGSGKIAKWRVGLIPPMPDWMGGAEATQEGREKGPNLIIITIAGR